MRRNLMVLSVAVTAMVVLAFLVPLFILVGDLAKDSAVSEGQREAESLARVLSVLVAQQTLPEAIEVVGEDHVRSVAGSVIAPNGEVFGSEVPAGEDLSLALEGNSFVVAVEENVAVYIPLLFDDGPPAVVRVLVSEEEMDEGVSRSRLILGLLGAILVGMAAAIADRMSTSMVVPIAALSQTAGRLGAGDLDARVTPSGPPEVEEMGAVFNRLAEQVARLLQQERETSADLAHRLRSPLTAARLSVEALEQGPERERLTTDIDELHRTIDFLIREARRPVRRETQGSCDLGEVVRERTRFWQPLAEEQGRDIKVSVEEGAVAVEMPHADAEAMVDALIENVLAHTEEGVVFSVGVSIVGDMALLAVSDGGQGLPDSDVLLRGVSSESTGLGLDIVRRTAEASGGSFDAGTSSLGGLRAEVRVPHRPSES